MIDQSKTLEEIQTILKNLRGTSGSRDRLPKQLWDSIIELTKAHPLKEVCRQLEIQPTYLKRKIQQSRKPPLDTVDFQEVYCGTRDAYFTDAVVIELMSDSGLRAKIQGPSTCLNCLSSLFGGK